MPLPQPLQITDNAKSWFNKLRAATQANTVSGSGAVTVNRGATETRVSIDPHSLGKVKDVCYKAQAKVSDLFSTEVARQTAETDITAYMSSLLEIINGFSGAVVSASNTLPVSFPEYCQYSDRNTYCWWKGYKKGEIVFVPYRILCGFDGAGYESPVWALPGVYICVADVPPVYTSEHKTQIESYWPTMPEALRPALHTMVRDSRIFYTPAYPARKLHPDLLKPFYTSGSLNTSIDLSVVMPQLRYWDTLSLSTTELTSCNAAGEVETYLVAGGRIDNNNLEDFVKPANPFVLNWQHNTVTGYINSVHGVLPNIDQHPML